MDTIIFTFFGEPITYLQAGLAGGGVLLVLVLIVVIAAMRGRSYRAEETARSATDDLRHNFNQQIADRDARIRALEERADKLSRTNTDLEARAASLATKLDEQTRNAQENYERLQSVRQQMTDEFKLIAQETMKSHGETFTKQNREQVDALLKPLNQKIADFQTSLQREQATMGERIRSLTEQSMRMAAEADNLTRALKGNTQTQGAWGEMILSSILERSGLREGEQYLTQQSHGADDGGRVRTDVEIIMPNNDRMVIDSKVSLTAFEAFTNADGDEARHGHLSDHVTSIRSHIKGLGDKQYQRHAGSGIDFVFMFVPIESAFSVAVGRDPGLIEYAIERGVIVTTPTTLLSALRTVRNVWDTEKRQKNAEIIAERAGALYDKVHGFLGTMDKVGEQLDRARKSYDDARGQLSEGRGNVVRQIEMLRELGAKSSKQISEDWAGAPSDPEEAPEAQTLKLVGRSGDGSSTGDDGES